MYKFHPNTRTIVNKYHTTVNPRVHMDDHLGLPPFDLVFTKNTPSELYLTGRDAFANHRLTADRRKGAKPQYDLILTIDGRKRRAYNLLYSPEKGLEVDHISRNTNDIRPENLRLATREQNIRNRINADQGEVVRHKNGLYFVRFPRNPDASKHLFEHSVDAETYLHKLQDDHFGEYGARRSQEIADKYDTHLFDALFLPIFPSADQDFLHEIESMPYYLPTQKGYYLNEARIELDKLNAEYIYLYQQATKALNDELTHADAEQRAEICRVLSWLEDGRYIINLGHFIGRIDDAIRMHLDYKNYCARQA